MKKNKGRIILSLLASILFIGAIGGTSYYFYKLANQNEIDKDKYEVTIKYNFDGILNDSLTKIFEFNKNEIIKINDYQIEVDDYKFKESSINEEYKVIEDKVINLYYVTSKDFNCLIYLSNGGINATYSNLKSEIFLDVNKDNSCSLLYFKNKIDVLYKDNLSGYTYNESKSSLDQDNKVVKLFYYTTSSSPLDDVTPNVTYDLTINMIYDNSLHGTITNTYNEGDVKNLSQYHSIQKDNDVYYYFVCQKIDNITDSSSNITINSNIVVDLYYESKKEENLVSLCDLKTSFSGGEDIGSDYKYELIISYDNQGSRLTLTKIEGTIFGDEVNKDLDVGGDERFEEILYTKTGVDLSGSYSFTLYGSDDEGNNYSFTFNS